MDALAPKDHAEEVALFRLGVIGALARRELDHRERRAALRALSEQRFRLPGADSTRRFSIPTLERWFYAFRKGGLPALRPSPRTPRGTSATA